MPVVFAPIWFVFCPSRGFGKWDMGGWRGRRLGRRREQGNENISLTFVGRGVADKNGRSQITATTNKTLN